MVGKQRIVGNAKHDGKAKHGCKGLKFQCWGRETLCPEAHGPGLFCKFQARKRHLSEKKNWLSPEEQHLSLTSASMSTVRTNTDARTHKDNEGKITSSRKLSPTVSR